MNTAEPCQEYELAIEALVDGELSGDEVNRLAEHLGGCRHCAAHRAALEDLRDSLGRLALAQDGPDVAEAVMRRLKHRTAANFALLAACVVAMKLLDMLGVFGAGLAPAIVLAAVVIGLFCSLGHNPFRIVRSAELLPVDVADRGASYATG